jgi:hypothetical protein
MAGLPSNPISINQSPAYGDQKALDKLKTGLTSTPMSGVPTPAPTAGRPPTRGGGSPQASPGGGGPQPVVPPEHQQLFDQFAQAMRAAQILTQAAQQPGAGPWTQFYAQVATKQYRDLAEKVRTDTPNGTPPPLGA